MEKDLYNLSDFIFDNTSSQSNNSNNKGILDICKIEKNLININHGMQMMHTDLNLFEDFNDFQDEYTEPKILGGYDDREEKEYGGIIVSKVKTILDYLYKNQKPYIRNFTKGTLTEIKVKKDFTLGTFFNITPLNIMTNEDFKTSLTQHEWIGLFFKDSNNVFDPKNAKRSYLGHSSKLLGVTFKFKDQGKIKFYKEENYDKEKTTVDEFKKDYAVMLKIKGMDLFIVNTKNIELVDMYQVKQDNKLVKIKNINELNESNPKTTDDITEMFKNMMNLCSSI